MFLLKSIVEMNADQNFLLACASIFSSLDEEKAADVLEELETNAQIHILEKLDKE